MNYFEYFSEIEERFVARRGSALLLSTLDWALIETWREAGVPLAAVLRGIDDAFSKHEARKVRARGRLAKVNGLLWGEQAVLGAATEMAEAAVGVGVGVGVGRKPVDETGFEKDRVASFLEANALALDRASTATITTREAMEHTAARLRELATEVHAGEHPALDELDRSLSVLEERLHAGVIAQLPEAELLALREAAEREIAPFRARVGGAQLRQVRESFMHKRLFEDRRIPRLSLFYMPLAEPGEAEENRDAAGNDGAAA